MKNCQNIVRQHDYDRYLLSLFAPTRARESLWALYAFNYEIAKTREVVSDTTIGLIRLQWWRDAIAEIYEGKEVRRHEVVQPLAEAVNKYNLPREDFDNLIYAREFDLEGVAPSDLEGLMKYCDYTSTPLMRLALKIIGDMGGEEEIKNVAVNYALIGMLRAVPYMHKQHRLMLPQDLMKRHDAEENKFFDFNEVKNISHVVQDVLDKVKKLKPKSKYLNAAYAIAEIYEGQIRVAGGDVFDPVLQHPPRFFAFRVWLKSF